MGLEVLILTDRPEQVYTPEYTDEGNLHSLSREFCNLMCRPHVVRHQPELDQIGQITGVDIGPLYQMETYPDEEAMACELEFAESDEERQQLIDRAETNKTNLKGNIDKVLQTINQLIEKLIGIENLPQRLLPTEFDTLNSPYYFSDFKVDKGEGYIRNNFGRDLRNFKRFLEYAKGCGVTTVWFSYG